MYHPPNIADKIPINAQFCIIASRPSMAPVISLDNNAETAKTIANSITNHTQCGRDSVGM